MIRNIANRIISDYFLLNRISEYEQIILSAIENGYLILKHSEFYELAKNNELSDKKILLIRHDIDSDPNYCYQWLKIDKKYGIKTSYYFRLCTLNKKVMNAVFQQGADCGYHFEELATLAKKKALSKEVDFSNYFPLLRTKFEENLKKVEDYCGTKITSIASHGDFMNRKIGVKNYEFLTPEFLKKNAIDFECYQSEFVSNYSINIIDVEYPNYFKGEISPLEALEREYQVVHLLVHPKNWRSNWVANSIENSRRLWEGIVYSIRLKLKKGKSN